MALSVLTGTGPFAGSKPCPISEGRQGLFGGMRNKEAVVTGAAVSRSATNTTAAFLDVYLFGHASARAEFLGVVSTDGAAQDMSIAASANDDEVVNVISDGYAKCLLGVGEVVRKGQWVEPINNASGHFRPCAAGGVGVGFADHDADNSAGSAAIYVGVHLRQHPRSSGLVDAIIASSATLQADAETAFSQTAVLAPANSLRVEDVFRISAKARVTDGATGDTLQLQVRLNTAAGNILGSSTSIDPATGNLIVFDLFVTIRSLGAAGTLTSGGLAVAAATPVATGSAGTVVIDTTAANIICVTANWSAATTDDVILEDLVVEKIAR
jgi:hypothetical protein